MGNLPEIQIERAPEPEPKLSVKLSPQGIGKLTEAIAQARKNFGSVKKTTKNPYYNSKYADLEEIIGATAQPLADQGIHIFQFISVDDREASVTTLIAHKSGEWIQSAAYGPAEQKTKEGVKFDIQTEGSATSYLRRYSAQAILFLAAEDDDGNAAASKPQPRPTPKAAEVARSSESERPKPAAKAKTSNVHGLEITDDDIPDFAPPSAPGYEEPNPPDPLPTPDQLKQIGEQLRGYKQDSRALKAWVEKEAGKPWKEISMLQFNLLLGKLSASKDVKTLIGG